MFDSISTGAIKMGGTNPKPKLSLELMNKLFFYFNLFLVLVLDNTCSQLVVSQSAVKFLPGFEGPLPFHFETG